MTSSPRPSRWRKVLLAQIVLWPILLLFAEGGARLFLRARGKPYSSEFVRFELARLGEQNRAFVPGAGKDPGPDTNRADERPLAHPYTGFELAAGMEQIDAERRFIDRTPRDAYWAVAVFGGSVAQMFSQFGGERLLEVLRADPRFAGRELHLFHFGRGGFRQPQQACLLAYLLTLGFQFDLVVALDGFNEVAIATQNTRAGAHPIYPSVPHWAHSMAGSDFTSTQIDLIVAIRRAQSGIDAWVARAERTHAASSALLGTLVLRRVNELRKQCAAAMTVYSTTAMQASLSRNARGPQLKSDIAHPIPASVRVWREGSRELRALSEGSGARYVHVLQPTMHDAGSKPLTERERELGTICPEWLAGVTKGYPLLRETGASLAAEGERFHDASKVFADMNEELYIDACHVNTRGSELLAERIGAWCLEALPVELGPHGLAPASSNGGAEQR